MASAWNLFHVKQALNFLNFFLKVNLLGMNI